eukprot:10773628-Ditylum_brightwellii.AAC.1
MRASYRPEFDITHVLSLLNSASYQSLIGMLRWMVELERIDICLEVPMILSHLAIPREGHMAVVLRIFAHLRKYHNTELVFDSSDPVVDELAFEQQDWISSVFGHVQGKKEIPSNMPESSSIGFVVRAKVDVDHTGDTITRQSRTDFI